MNTAPRFRAMWLCTDEDSLILPYWLLNLQETIGLLIGKTEFVATSQANIVKTALLSARREAAQTERLKQGNQRRFAGTLCDRTINLPRQKQHRHAITGQQTRLMELHTEQD